MRINWRLIGILTIGFGLRCINLSTRGIQYDDAFSIFLARQGFTEIVQGTAADTMPPLYYFLLHFWMQISTGIGWLRILSVCLDLLGVLLLYLLIGKVISRSAGIWAAFFAVISPLQIYHSQDIRMYTLLASAQIGYLFFFYRWWLAGSSDWREWGNWVGMILCGTAAMYTHNLAIFLLGMPNLFLLVKRNWKALGKLLLVQMGIGLLSAPWLIMIPGQVEKIQRAFWTPQPGVVEVFQAIIMMTTNLPLDGMWLVVGAVISLELLVLIGWETIKIRTENIAFLLITFIGPPVLLFAVSYIMRPIFVPRGFLSSTLIYLGLAGAVTATTLKKPVRWILVTGFVLAAFIGLPYQLSFEQFPRSPFDRAMQQIRLEARPDERIVHDNKLSLFPSFYYAPDLKQYFVADEPRSSNDTYALASQKAIGLLPEATIEAAVGDAKSIFYVVFQKTMDEYKALGFADHPHLSWLKSQFPHSSSMRVGDLLIYRFKTLP